jgi:hypothetical protein
MQVNYPLWEVHPPGWPLRRDAFLEALPMPCSDLEARGSSLPQAESCYNWAAASLVILSVPHRHRARIQSKNKNA